VTGVPDFSVHDPQDKGYYCKQGVLREKKFIAMMNQHSQIKVRENPEKKSTPKGKYAADLWVPEYGYCDLKSQETPFFKSMGKSGIPPENAVTFNSKDLGRYRRVYENIGIFFWVNWIKNESKYGKCPYRWGIYFIRLREILEIIDSSGASSHAYLNRKEEHGDEYMASLGMNSDGNALESWLLNVDLMEPVLISQNNPWI
jgi:hypothetical protein